MIIALVKDIYFIAKIGETAKQLGVGIEFVNSASDIKNSKNIIVDLEEFFYDIPVIRDQNPGAEILGFLSHTKLDLKKRAANVGVKVMVKSEFSKQLPNILK